MMHMTFYWGKTVTILFDSWKTDSWASYSLTLLACFLFASFYQYMEDRRLRFLLMGITRPSINTNTPPRLGARVCNSARVATSVLFGVNSAIAYMIMLAVMSFNWGVLIAIVSGFGVGYFCFRGKGCYEGLVVQDNCDCE